MHDISVSNIIRAIKVIYPEDTIGKASEVMRVSGLVELPVISGMRIVGMLTEGAILSALTTEDAACASEQPVSSIMSENVISVNPYMTVRQVAEILTEHSVQVVPVIGDWGNYMGVVTRSDIAGVFCLTMRPPSIAGMATPLGVYLTTGNLRAGASDLGLFLTGVALMFINFISTGLIGGLAYLVQSSTHFKLWNVLLYRPVVMPHIDIIRDILLAVSLPVFLILLRMSSLAGYHAAEHQTVHAIENGEPLKPDYVARMPRAHPRCGTNIMAAVILFTMVSDRFSSGIAVPLAVIVFLFAWRNIGSFVQNFLTTKPPTDGQLKSGIKAGEELLAKYRENPAYRITGWQRIWNTGLPQVMIGAAAATGTVGHILHRMLPGLFF